jgi:hypothetical protein
MPFVRGDRSDIVKGMGVKVDYIEGVGIVELVDEEW